MPDIPNTDTTARLFGEAIAFRSILGVLTAAIGDLKGNRVAFITDLVAVCSENIERLEIRDDPDRADVIKEYAHEAVEQTVGTLRGSHRHP